jgi:hypothetical protein
MNELLELSPNHRGTIVELGRGGPGGDFDENVLCELFDRGLIEVHCQDRRLMLTERGPCAYRELLEEDKSP